MDEQDRPSKTQRKREVESLQAMGAELVLLSRETLESFDLPTELAEAVVEAKKIKQHSALRRQLQFIGKVMRNIDPEPIRQRLQDLKKPSRRSVKLMHEAEIWRDSLINKSTSLSEFTCQFPRADANEIQDLIVACRSEITKDSKKSYRKLFKLISETLSSEENTN
jgi:ribosome-associated protein